MAERLCEGTRMQAYGGQYLCPYFTCTSPYCIAIRSNVTSASSIPSSRNPTSSSASTGTTSFSISSILSRSDESTEGKEVATDLSSSTKTETSISLGSYKHYSMERFHPYHSSLGVSAFTRAGGCGTIQKGKKADCDFKVIPSTLTF